jgi:integrase
MSTERAAERRKPTRPRGDGSVFQRTNGRWCYAFKPLEGRRKVGYARSEAEALEKLRKALVDRDAGLPVVSKTHTVGTWIGRWIETLPEADTLGDGGLRASTLARYRWCTSKVRADRIARLKLYRLEGMDVAEAMARWRDDGLSAGSIAAVLHVLRASLDAAMAAGHVGRNVARPPHIRMPKATRRTAGKPPTRDELRRLRDELIGHELEALYLLCMDAGLRIGEALALTWSSLEPSGNLNVRHSAHSKSGTLGPTKGGRPRRLPLDAHTIEALERHRRSERGVIPARTARIFVRPDGTPIRHREAEDRWYAVCAAAEVPRCRVHDLRHSFATRWLEGHGPLAMLSNYLGHASISITADIYGHPELEAPGLAPAAGLTPQHDTSSGRRPRST